MSAALFFFLMAVTAVAIWIAAAEVGSHDLGQREEDEP